MKNKFKRTGKFYAYIVECADGTYYTGYAKDLKKRIKEHNNTKRGARYTRYKKPVRLVWRKEYRYFKKAAQKERTIKKMAREEKEKLIAGQKLIGAI